MKQLFTLLIASVFVFCSFASSAQGALFPARIGNLYGYIDKTGQLKIPATYRYAYLFSEGLASVELKDGKQGYINQKGVMVLKDLKNPANFSEGLAAVMVGNKYGYIDKTGNMVIAANYKNAQEFKDGLAPVQLDNGHYGMINKEGKLVIDFKNAQTAYIDSWKHEKTVMVKNGYNKSGFFYAWLDINGDTVLKKNLPGAENFSEDLAAFHIHDGQVKWGYMNRKGEIVIAPQYEAAGPFHSGMASVKLGNKWGYINKAGKMVIAPTYMECYDFSEGMAMVNISKKIKSSYNDTMAFIDTTGKIKFTCPPLYTSKGFFKNGLVSLLVMEKNKTGYRQTYLNKNGKIVFKTSTPANVCFPGHALVSTPTGVKPISEIQVGDVVMCTDADLITTTKVLEIIKHEPEENGFTVMEMTYENRMVLASAANKTPLPTGTLGVTPNHPLITAKGPVPAGMLKPGYEMLYVDPVSNRIEPATITGIKTQPYEKTVYNLVTEIPNYLVNGILVSAK